MPLTNRNDVRNSLMDSVFARGDLSKAMPKYQFPDRESFPADVFQVIQDELLLDGNARQNLATFCQTWEEPEIHKIMDLAIDKNMVDKDEYPLTAEIESRTSFRLVSGTDVLLWAVAWSHPQCGFGG